jgi:hypothetical protein
VFDPQVFEANRVKFTFEDLIPYEYHYVAWSVDGSRILAASKSLKDLYGILERLGKPECVHGFIDFDSHAGGLQYDPQQEMDWPELSRQVL